MYKKYFLGLLLLSVSAPLFASALRVTPPVIDRAQPKNAPVCRPINYMAIACLDGSPSHPVLDENGCITGFSCSQPPFTPPTSCKTWFDGCNACSRSKVGAPAICTMRACQIDPIPNATTTATTTSASLVQGKAACTSFFPHTQPIACLDDVKTCSDGSTVVRVLPSCEFAKCRVPHSRH